MKTYWLSFSDSNTGENLGVCVVEVSAEHADEAVAIVKRIHPLGICPPGEEWTVAAVGQSLRMGCNPGGSMLAKEIVDPSVLPPDLPRHTLVRLDQLRRNGRD